MSARTLLILIALTVAAGLAAWGLAGRDNGGPAGPSGALLEGFDERVNDVVAVVVSTPLERFTVRRTGQGWVMDERDGYPVAFETVKQTLLGLAEMSVLERKTDNPELYDRIGVEDPEVEGSESIQFTLLGETGSALAAVVVGDAGPSRGTRYVRRAGEEVSWLVRLDLVPERRASFWLERELIEVEPARVRSVTITHPDGEQVVVAKEAREDVAWVLRDVPEDREPLNATIGRTLAGALENLTLEDVRAAAGAPLSAEQQVVAVYETFDGLRLTLITAPEGESTWMRLQAEAVGEATEDVREEADEMQARLSGWAFSIPQYRSTSLRKRMDDLTREKEPAQLELAEPEGLESPFEPDLDEPDAEEPATEPAEPSPAEEGEGAAADEPSPGEEPSDPPSSDQPAAA
jgi:hypothetical protein